MNSIKESFDNLPVAVCFFDKRGVVRLMNRRMLSVGAELLGSGVQTLEELRRALDTPPESIERLDAEMGVYKFPNGTVLRFVERQITDKSGGSYTEVTASDVTRLVTLQQELRKENARLEDANLRLKRLYDRMPEIVREEETLAMKLRVHDDIGHTILSARRALRQGESMEAIRESAEAWESTIELLCRANSMEEPEDAIEYAKARAAELGAEVIVEGSAPKDGEMRHIFALAIRECTSNCIRHAGGKRIFARFAPYRGGWGIHITNDGKVPDDEITEGGGLSALRRRIENAGGIMRIKSRPNFALSALLPYGEENKW